MLSLDGILHKYSGKKNYSIKIEKSTDGTGDIRVLVYKEFRFFNFSISKLKDVAVVSKLDAIYLNIDNKDDRSIDFAAYMKFAEDCFNENNMPDEKLDILHTMIGLSGEIGEIQEHIKKWIFHGKPLDKTKLLNEFGDSLWYQANALRLLGLDLSSVLTANHIKLTTRYPNGRSKNYTLNSRNEDQEELAVNTHLSGNRFVNKEQQSKS